MDDDVVSSFAIASADIVFIGEIRDGEAAEISMRAASSGNYVFSTLHTRDVASTVTALRVDPRSLVGNLLTPAR